MNSAFERDKLIIIICFDIYIGYLTRLNIIWQFKVDLWILV